MAYSEVLPDEKGPTCAEFVERALTYFAAHGISRVERLMTDNAWAYDVLTMLSDRPDRALRARDLGSRLKWSTSRLTHKIGRMEQRGRVARSPIADDARGAVITLTEDGWHTLLAAAPLHVESVRRNLIDLLSPAELRTLDQIARKVLDHLQPGAADIS